MSNILYIDVNSILHMISASLPNLVFIHTESGSLYSHRDHNTRVFIPAQQRILSILRLGLPDVRTPRHEILVRVGSRESAGDSCIHWLYDFKVGGKKYVKVALVDLVQLSERSIEDRIRLDKEIVRISEEGEDDGLISPVVRRRRLNYALFRVIIIPERVV